MVNVFWRLALATAGIFLRVANGQFDDPNVPQKVTPTIFDPAAPNPQKCPGYIAASVASTDTSFVASLRLAGRACNVFGKDIADLKLEVSYQTTSRLNVKIYPARIEEWNKAAYILDSELVLEPKRDGRTTSSTSDLEFHWSNEPSFQFAIRRKNGEEIFSTFGHVLVYENQFIELITNMVEDYNVYGLPETMHGFHLGTNFTRTLFNNDFADTVDGNGYSSHPFYQETRYHSGKQSTAHGVYARNAHAQEWLLREKTITYRAIGGSFDFYFFSGQKSEGHSKNDASSALEVIRQYQVGASGLPAMQMYWAFGFHQCHWGWSNTSQMQDVVEKYAAANIPLESIWNDIDVYDKYRVFSNNPTYPSSDLHEFVNWLHSRDQRYVPIQDAMVYFPDPRNETDVASYPPFTRGAEVGAFIRDATTGYFYVGQMWPGYTVWTDWLSPVGPDYWKNELRIWHETVPFDGLWIDILEPYSSCTFSCGNVELAGTNLNSLPPNMQRPLSDGRELNFPPYKINNVVRSSRTAVQNTIAFNATHSDRYNTTEYDVHSLYPLGLVKASYEGISSIIPGKRPFMIVRSTFVGSGQYVGHWGGDNSATWGSMALSIPQAFSFMMVGIPMFGADTCGFAQDSNEELCARWMELSAFFPFYRNHYGIGKADQEAYIWPTVAEASRRAIAIRYSLLTYLYTLFYYAHKQGDTVMRALAWEFPNDITLRGTDTQFMVGPSLLVTPVLEPGATTVMGVFPGIKQGTRWFDWYTLQEVDGVQPHQNVTMSAPLEHINLHIRGGSILPLQAPDNTTSATRKNPYSLIIAPDENGQASGSLYLDDGESVQPEETKLIQFNYSKGTLRTQSSGQYAVAPPLANITVLGVPFKPRSVMVKIGGHKASGFTTDYASKTFRVSGLEKSTAKGAWNQEVELRL